MERVFAADYKAATLTMDEVVLQADAVLRLGELALPNAAECLIYARGEGADETVRLLETTRRRTVTLVAYGEVFAVETGPLLPTTGNLSGFEIVADGSQLLLVYGVPGHRRDLPPPAGAEHGRGGLTRESA